ncbi:short-subunit dehydrogenase [Glaciihabitans tibetensis]|uniref:Short-subunit dehydrogenase n=1 Tax=Glaciihabitans tibetensis TaxID=1266600 RepID=A0A2T0VGL6_9MICO|nr:oxidoreductase [Glaciihabitans tibetensis]PRY69354.1 short-subunit dehydrogenase [Glaciihabitans tibetensis]
MVQWTAADVADQRGRTVVITGANSGLGAEATRVLAGRGARVIAACRDVDRASAFADTVAGEVEVRHLDLAELASVRAFAAGIDTDIDVLINSAGVMAVARGRTADGFERHIGTNHLGPFVLTNLLLDRVSARVVTVTSGLHVLGRISPDLNWERRRYQRWLAYAQSKLANAVFAYELQRRLAAAGRNVISVAAHPGVAATEGQRRDTSLQGKILAGGRAQSPAMGALPILFAATTPGVRGGTCIGPDGRFQRNGFPTEVRTSRASRDATIALNLWSESERLTGLRAPLDAL